MTASTTPCCASRTERLLGALLVMLALWLPAAALWADEAVLERSRISLREEGYVLDADIAFKLNPRLSDAVNRGVSLYFVTEFQIEQPRWYWFDKVVARRQLNYRLSYHAITRSYRLSLGNLHQSFDSLDEAVRTLQRVRNWPIADAGSLEPGEDYRTALRFRLDTTQLPKPFQVTAIGSRDWQLSTDWVSGIFRVDGMDGP